jgi:suppressor for copper-sensitivity B
MPVTIATEESQNIDGFEVLWPAPKRYIYYGLESWAYAKEVAIPVKIKVADNSAPAEINMDVKWAICDEICIFEDNKFFVKVSPSYKNDNNSSLIAEYLKNVPLNIADQDSIKLNKFKAYQDAILFDLESEQAFDQDVDLFTFQDKDRFKFAKPQISFSEDRKEISVIAPYSSLSKNSDLTESPLQVTISNSNNSVYFEVNIDEVSSSKILPAEKTEKLAEDANLVDDFTSEHSSTNSASINIDISIWLAILFAFLGGLILNIMPCVLPVLSIKIMSVLKHDAKDLVHTRKSFFYTVLGILFSFLVLAALTITLKQIGGTVGWGVQFQQPAFLIFLIMLLTLFTANMFGLFELSLNSKATNSMNELIDKKGDSTPLGNFLIGAFATLMATPCTAPFLSTAVTFAITAEIITILVIFLAIGLGMAFPYILVTIFPQIARIFPKPGSWMSKVKIVLAIFLLLSVLWFLWVFMASAGSIAFLVLTFTVIATFIFLVAAKKYNLEKKRVIYSIIYIIVVSFLVPLYFASIVQDTRTNKEEWLGLDEAKIKQLVENGETVFIDITAEWCLTCQFNKARVTSPMKPFFEENNVVLMMGDYTNPSEKIDRFLSKRNVYGIPYNAVYGPNAPDGIKLPELLTEDSVRKAVFDAKDN